MRAVLTLARLAWPASSPVRSPDFSCAITSKRRLVPHMGMAVTTSSGASLYVDTIGGHMTELLELKSERASLQIIFVPGNPGVVTYYKEYLEALYDFLEGQASITAISHIAHTSTAWENGVFSLEEQIDHKVHFVQREVIQRSDLPIVLVGHSIGAYIIMEVFKKFPSQVQQVIGLYPFLSLNTKSKQQGLLRRIAETPALCTAISSFAGLVGRFPPRLSRGLVKVLLGRVWGSTAVDVTCEYLLQSSVVRNFLYMGRTEFAKLPKELDWEFLRENQSQIHFLFGRDDHWGPLSLLDEISKEVPKLALTREREGHVHAFCCTQEGSLCVGRHTADIILSQVEVSPLKHYKLG